MMKLLVPLAVLVGALASPSASASDLQEVFTASTHGDLAIDAEGRVVEVKLDHQQLGEGVMKSFEQQMMGWRFEPILHEGKPVKAYAYVNLALFVVRQPGEQGVRIGFKEVTFIDATDQGAADVAARRVKPPRYPRRPADHGVGARVKLFVQTDDEGRVIRSAVEELLLLGGEVETNQVERHVEAFREASEQAAAGWVIPDVKGGRAVVPVLYTPPGFQGRWVRTRMAPVQAPAWVAEERAKDEAAELGDGGVANSERWKLQTPIGG